MGHNLRNDFSAWRMRSDTARILIAGASGDSGKTLVALGLIAALRRRGSKVVAFKKGPDYIDAAWLGEAAGAPCFNLDTMLMGVDTVRYSFARRSSGADIAVIEGNRGLHDGVDSAGTHSSATLARELDAPVLLVLNATKSTRTLAGIVLGMKELDRSVRIGGVILNRTAGARHVRVAKESIENETGVPVLGAIPKLAGARRIPGRHLGLLPVSEYEGIKDAMDYAASVVEKYVDIGKLNELASRARAIEVPDDDRSAEKRAFVRVGVLRDGAFSFYYPENLEALEFEGAEVIPVHSASENAFPDIDALYIGGGFPETHAEQLVGNEALRSSIARAAGNGMPVFAECGGLMYLSESIAFRGEQYPMCGVLPCRITMHEKPEGHGYVELKTELDNPFFEKGADFKGHEFHYSQIEAGATDGLKTVFALERGTGVGGGRDGLVNGNVLAMYTHLHALSVPKWACGVVEAAARYKNRANGSAATCI